MNEKTTNKFTTPLPSSIATRLLKFLSHLADQQEIADETKELNQNKHFEEALVGQKKILPDYYNSCEGDPFISLYHYPNGFWLQTNSNAPGESTQGKPILLDESKLEEMIENPLISSNYLWEHEGMGIFEPGYPIEVACEKGWKEMVLRLIQKNHLIPISRAKSLRHAVEKNHHEIVQYLIEAGVSATECDVYRKISEDGKITLDSSEPLMCPLYYAIRGNAIESAKLLLESGASFDDLSFVHPRDKNYKKEQQRTVRQSIDEEGLTFSSEMQNIIDEHEKLKRHQLHPMLSAAKL